MEVTQRNLLILKLYKWKGIKYGFFLGVFIGLSISMFRPTLAGEIYISIPLVCAASSMLLSLTGYFFYPMFLGVIGATPPLDEELVGFMLDREGGFGITGAGDSEIGGTSSSTSDGSGGDSGD